MALPSCVRACLHGLPHAPKVAPALGLLLSSMAAGEVVARSMHTRSALTAKHISVEDTKFAVGVAIAKWSQKQKPLSPEELLELKHTVFDLWAGRVVACDDNGVSDGR